MEYRLMRFTRNERSITLDLYDPVHMCNIEVKRLYGTIPIEERQQIVHKVKILHGTFATLEKWIRIVEG